MYNNTLKGLFLGITWLWLTPDKNPVSAASAVVLDLECRSRQDSIVSVHRESVEASRVAIVAVDVWNYHYCKTWVGRAGGLVPRMNRVFDMARELGITIIHAPTEVVGLYAGTPQRESIAALPRHPIQSLKELNEPPRPAFSGSNCMCGGPYECEYNCGEAALDPNLQVADTDFISSDAQEVYNLCQERGITHLIYTGFATNACLLDKPDGMKAMLQAGLHCCLARDLTEAWAGNTGSEAADQATRTVVAHIEEHLAPSIDLAAELRQAGGSWNEDWRIDPVMLRPWGFKDRPKFFDETLEISMSIPRLPPSAKVCYSVDGEEPTPRSKTYREPFVIHETTQLRAVAYQGEKQVSLESQGYYVRLPARPPEPDVHLSDLDWLKVTMAEFIDWWSVPCELNKWGHYSKGSNPPPQRDRSYAQTSLKLRRINYARGLGVRAPSSLIYKINPDYDRFVALVGIEEGLLERDNGRFIALYPSIIFKVFFDGKLHTSSPVMRILEEPWRFDLKIPPGTRLISLIATDASAGNRGDLALANWVNAGFILKK